MIPIVLSLLLAGAGATAPKDTSDDPAFKMMATMADGNGEWVGNLGPMTIHFKYELAEKGTLLKGVGYLDTGKGKQNMVTTFGWDPEKKQTYYLDCHGHNVVYFGHVTLQKKTLVLDFNGLVGDKGHWVSRIQMPTSDRYEFEMYEEKSGKFVPLHVGVKLHRA